MNRIATVFFVSIYGLTAFAGVMLAIAEESAFPAILTPPLALVAYWLTDRARLFHFPVFVANLLGLAAFIQAGWQMYANTTEGRLLAGAHTVVYLTWIVLFQQKRLPQYWWMCALSIPQVAVGAILTNSSSYGGLLVAFMFASIWTLSIFSLYQAWLSYGESGGADGRTAWVGLKGEGAGGWKSRKRGQSPAKGFFSRASVFRGTIQLDPEERWMGARFGLSMLAVSCAALVVAAAFFLFIPRLWAGRTEWGHEGPTKSQSIAMAGFTEQVRLADFVPLLERSQRVMQISLFNSDGAPIDVDQYCKRLGYAEPLFRGATMESYENGTWTRLSRRPSGMVLLLTRPEEYAHCVRQKILMEPIGTPILFAIHPVEALNLASTAEQAEYHPPTQQMFRPDSVSPDKAIAYEVYSPPSMSFTNQLMRLATFPRTDEGYMNEYSYLSETKLPQLVKLARKLTGFDPENPLPPGQRQRDRNRRYVDILCNYLRDSGNYRYSLDTSVHDPKIDPVEDFLINRKTGHCQYFASALTLMLRAVGVPARLVSGFKGGAVNSISGIYEVEQRHAHTWVEAFHAGEGARSELWVTVDPTPAARDASVESFASQTPTAHQLASVITSTWSSLMNMDVNQQQTAFYVPIVEAIKNWWRPAEGGRPLIATLIEGIISFITDPTQWFTVTGLITASLIGATLAGIVLAVRMRKRVWSRLRAFFRPKSGEADIRIAFYERFEKLCTHMGLTRSRVQTQREFAGTVGPRIRQLVASADGLPDFPPRLVEFFYRARFGDEELSLSVIDQLNRDLTTLEAAVRNPHHK